MKTSNEELAETGLTCQMLNRMKDLGLIPRLRLNCRGHWNGMVGLYEENVINIINDIKLQQNYGLSLT
jgi:hypothetical protein